MSFHDASRAVEAFLDTLSEAKRIAAFGQTGSQLDDLLQRAKKWLDVMDDELQEFDRTEYAHLFAAAVRMRRKLQGFGDELRAGRRTHTKAPETPEYRSAMLERMPKRMQERIARAKRSRQ